MRRDQVAQSKLTSELDILNIINDLRVLRFIASTMLKPHQI
jgi:hypothetical protein